MRLRMNHYYWSIMARVQELDELELILKAQRKSHKDKAIKRRKWLLKRGLSVPIRNHHMSDTFRGIK